MRSIAHADQQNDMRQEGETRSDDVQDRVAETINESATAAIPIPSALHDSDDDSDIESHADNESHIAGSQRAPSSAWRNLMSGNLLGLSGETLSGRQTPADRNR